MAVTVDIGPDTRMMYAKIGRVNGSRYITIPTQWNIPVGTKLDIRLFSADGTIKTLMIRNVSTKGTSRVVIIPYRDATWAEVGDMVHVIAEVLDDDDAGRSAEIAAEVDSADA